MNHPNDEELVDFFDGQLAAPRQAEIGRHVAECDECNGRVAAWRHVRHELQSWELSEQHARPSIASPRRASSWQRLTGVAAAIAFLAIGFGLARLTAPRISTAQIRADLTAEIRDELRADLQTDLSTIAAALSTEQHANQLAILRGLQQLDARWLDDFGNLRKDIETVALRTQEEFARRAISPP